MLLGRVRRLVRSAARKLVSLFLFGRSGSDGGGGGWHIVVGIQYVYGGWKVNMVRGTHASGLEDFAKAGEIVDTGVERFDAVV